MLGGGLSVRVNDSVEVNAGATITLQTDATVVLKAGNVLLGSNRAAEPYVKGSQLVAALAALQIPVVTTPAGMVAQGPPTNLAQFQAALSSKIRGE